jgi:uncharacterized phage-associated protein
MMYPFNFDKPKAIEAIVYIASRIEDPTFHSVSKLLYFADKTHLEKYGRFICGETYYAMQYGPVPTHIYAIFRDALPNDAIEEAIEIRQERHVIARRAANLDLLSDSDIECLDKAIAMYGDAPMWRRTEDSHDEAWKSAWEKRGERGSVEMPLESIAAMFDNADTLLAYLKDQHPG